MIKIYSLLVSTIILMAWNSYPKETDIPEKTVIKQLRDKNTKVVSLPPCLEMYKCIEKYADSFNIPKKYAYGIAYNETRYKGPFNWVYDHALTSPANAVGPMQIKLRTARGVNKDSVSLGRLRTDIDYNVLTSMKLLRRLKNKYGDWKSVFGAYNSGRPIINNYAIRVYNFNVSW